MQQTAGYFQFYDKFERNQLVKATDIARYQYPLANSTINGYNSYQDNGNEFIILKAGNQSMENNDSIIDLQFTVENVNKFKDSKLKIGTYWYCRHLNVNIQEATYPDKITDANIIAESTIEANNYADILESVFGAGACGDIIPCLDFEDNRWSNTTITPLSGQGILIGTATNSNTITGIIDTWYSTASTGLAVGTKIDIKTASTGAIVYGNRTVTAINSNTSITIDGTPVTMNATHVIQRVAYANDEWAPEKVFLYMKTFKDVMCSRFPQLSAINGGKGIMLYTAKYYVDECSTSNDIKNISGVGIVSEIPALWLAANTNDIGALNAGYNGTIATCATTIYSSTINTSATSNTIAVGNEIVIVDTNKNILGNGTVTAKPTSLVFTYNGVPVTVDSSCTVVKVNPYPNYNLSTFGGYDKWMIWQYSSDRNRLGKQYSANTITIDLDVFDNNNFSMNEILSYPYTKPKLVEILEDKADKTHSHIGQYIPTNGGTFDGDTTITSPIAFIFKQEKQKSFKMSRNNSDYTAGKASKLFITPSTDVWTPSGTESGVTFDVTKSVGIGTDGFIYHSQVATEGYIYGLLPATIGWYRVAQCPATVLTSTGTFTFRNNASGDRTCGKFVASSSYGSSGSTNLTQLAYSKYSANGITQARLVYQDSTSCYLEVYHNAAVASVLEIVLSDNLNWVWTAFNTGTNTFANGSVPGSSTEKVLTFNAGLVSTSDVISYAQLKSTTPTGTSPLSVLSTTKVINLNADKLDDLESDDFVKKDGSVVMTGNLTLNADPTQALHASTKQYVDAIASGYKTKDSCIVASTTNIASLSTLLTIDGVTVVAGNRVLVWQQTNAIENGIYVAGAGAWTRATDFDSSTEIVAGAYTFITGGATYANNGFSVTTTGTITPDTTPFNFTITTGAGTIAAGTGLTKTGNTFSITNTGVSPTTYQSVTVNEQGQVTAGTNPTTLLGYGITDAADIVHDHTSISGSSATLTTPRAITITGDASGTTSFDGSADVSIAVTMTGGNVYANVKSFGALGDGVTNDSSAIQSALNSISSVGGSVIFPQGTYAIETALEVYSNTKITGIGNVVLKRNSNANNMMRNKADGTTGLYDANTNIEINNIKFNANNTISGGYDCSSLAFGHANNITIINCEFYNNDGWHCLELNGVKSAIVDNCYFHDYGDPTSDTTRAYVTEMLQLDIMKSSTQFPWFGPYDNTYCDNITIQNCRFEGNESTDLYWYPSDTDIPYYKAIGNHSFTSTYYPRNVRIVNNKFENITAGIGLDDVNGLTIDGNKFKNMYVGVMFEPQIDPSCHICIVNNKFYGIYSQTAATYGVCRFVMINEDGLNTANSYGFIISNNNIKNCHHHGIAGTVNKCVVTNNIIETCGRAGIYAYGGSSWNISNNRISDCNKHSANYAEIMIGVNPSTATTSCIVSNNNATVIRCGVNQSGNYVTGNLVTSFTTPENSIVKANVVNGAYLA